MLWARDKYSGEGWAGLALALFVAWVFRADDNEAAFASDKLQQRIQTHARRLRCARCKKHTTGLTWQLGQSFLTAARTLKSRLMGMAGEQRGRATANVGTGCRHSTRCEGMS